MRAKKMAEKELNDLVKENENGKKIEIIFTTKG